MSAPLRHAVVPSPVDDLTLVADDDGLVAVLWADEHRGLIPGVGPETPTDPVLAAAAAQLGEYFAGARRSFDLPLAPRGEAFAQRVWGLLREIPFGATCSYGDLARELGQPGAAQAVGAANGANPLAIVVPCHRVVGSDGALTGFAGGLRRKRWLLAHEEPPADEAGRLF